MDVKLLGSRVLAESRPIVVYDLIAIIFGDYLHLVRGLLLIPLATFSIWSNVPKLKKLQEVHICCIQNPPLRRIFHQRIYKVKCLKNA